MIMKQAIEYNLAGFTKNPPHDVVNFTLQGDGKRLTDAVSAIQNGTKKSSICGPTTGSSRWRMSRPYGAAFCSLL
jgi:hypothetical protein